jgi:hypothetical protein
VRDQPESWVRNCVICASFSASDLFERGRHFWLRRLVVLIETLYCDHPVFGWADNALDYW